MRKWWISNYKNLCMFFNSITQFQQNGLPVRANAAKQTVVVRMNALNTAASILFSATSLQYLILQHRERGTFRQTNSFPASYREYFVPIFSGPRTSVLLSSHFRQILLQVAGRNYYCTLSEGQYSYFNFWPVAINIRIQTALSFHDCFLLGITLQLVIWFAVFSTKHFEAWQRRKKYWIIWFCRCFFANMDLSFYEWWIFILRLLLIQ